MDYCIPIRDDNNSDCYLNQYPARSATSKYHLPQSRGKQKRENKMSTIIAIALFIVLCPTVSYIVVRRRITPWSGGIFFLLDDESLAPMNWKDCKLPSTAKIKGVFLSGAKASMQPEVSFRMVNTSNEEIIKKGMFYHHVVEKNNGVYLMYYEPIPVAMGMLIIDVVASYPWTGYEHHSSDCSYYNYTEINAEQI